MKSFRNQIISFISFLVIMVSANSAQAQSPWLLDSIDNSIGVEIMKPFIDDGDAISFFSLAQIISGRYRLSDAVLLSAEIPFSNFNSKVNESEFTLGNPYLGVIINNKSKSYFLEVGLRIPVSSDNKFVATTIGTYADFSRAEAYRPKYISISIKNHYLKKYESDFVYKLMGGFSFWTPTEEVYWEDFEWLFDYSGQIGFDNEQFQVLGGISSRLIINQHNWDFRRRTVHHFDFSARYKSNKIHPGLQFKIPFDDELRNIIDFVLGVNLLIYLD